MNSVQEFFKGKTIFVTGASGFMGKVLIEKLLYSCSDLKQLIILMREKKGKSAMARIKDFEALPLFKRILEEKPEVMQKILVVTGEVSEKNLGMSDAHWQHIIDNTEIIFSAAASTSFQDSLKAAVLTNLASTKQVIEMAKQMKNLKVLVHASTAFCNLEHDTVDEVVYEAPNEPLKVIEMAYETDEKAILELEKTVLDANPNTYVYTKRMSEALVRDEFERSKLPICIVRPSLVGPALNEPLPGWVDSLSVIGGMILGFYKGILRSVLMDLSVNYNFIPVDLAINGFIMAAKHVATTPRAQDVPVFNMTMHKSVVPNGIGFYKTVMSMINVYPFSTIVWYPRGIVTPNKTLYRLNHILFQTIPSLFADCLLVIFGKKPFLLRTQQKIAEAFESVAFFTVKNYNFETENFQGLVETQSEDEKKTFLIDTKKVDPRKFYENAIIGGRVYQAGDPMSTIPQGKRLIKFLYILDLVVKGLFFYWIAKFLMPTFKILEPTS